MQPLARFVLSTIAYYDAMDMPLTGFEVWRFLHYDDVHVPAQYRKRYALHEVLSALDALVRDAVIVHVDGMYVLAGREGLVVVRRQRSVRFARVLRRVRRAVSVLRYVPFMRMILLTGRLAAKRATAHSDWDVLIVTAGGRIWWGRLLVMLVATLLGRRKTDRRHADRLCFNHFITDASLTIVLDDRFSAHEYMMARMLFSSIRPSRFFAANMWIQRFRPQYDTWWARPWFFVSDTRLSYGMRSMGERIISALPRLADFVKRCQRRKIMRNPKTYRRGAMIIANDRALIFLPQPHAPRVFAAYQQRATALGLRCGGV